MKLKKAIGWTLLALVSGTMSLLFLLGNDIELKPAIITVVSSLILAGLAILSFNLINTK